MRRRSIFHDKENPTSKTACSLGSYIGEEQSLGLLPVLFSLHERAIRSLSGIEYILSGLKSDDDAGLGVGGNSGKNGRGPAHRVAFPFEI